MEDEDSTDYNIPGLTPQSAIRVARRSLVLSAVICRASIDNNASHPDAESLHNRVLDWLTQLNLWDEVEPDEEQMLRAPRGTLDAKEVIQSTWYVEGLAILTWALNHFEFPKHDEQVDAYEVTDSLWFLDESAADIIANAELRSPVELEACHELLYAVHCRLRDFARYGKPKDFTQWIEKTWLDALNLEAAQLIAQNDLAIDGKAISKAEEDRLRECNSITLERHRAIIWLVEGYPIYSETPVDT